MYNIESVNIHCHHIHACRRMCMCVYVCVCVQWPQYANKPIQYCTKILYTQFASLPESSSLLSLHQLNGASQFYFDLGISDTTRKTYKTGLNKYQTFCSQFKQSAVPTTEETLVLLITHLAKQQLSPTQPYRCTCQLSVTLMLLIRNTKPSMAKITPWISQILKGIQKMQSLTQSPKERHPITFPIMEWLHSVLTKHSSNYYNLMTWLPVIPPTLDSYESVNLLSHLLTTLMRLLTCYCQTLL